MRNLNPKSISFFLFLYISITTTKSTNIINTTCKKCTIQSPYLNYKFCTTSLNTFPLNHTINNLKELANIAMNLTLTNTTDAILTIQKLINGEDHFGQFDEFGIGCLNDCLELYNDAIYTIQDSIEAFLDGKYDDANLLISAVMESSVTCGEGFSEKRGEVNPLTKENYRVYELGDIALCIINLVHSQCYSLSQSS